MGKGVHLVLNAKLQNQLKWGQELMAALAQHLMTVVRESALSGSTNPVKRVESIVEILHKPPSLSLDKLVAHVLALPTIVIALKELVMMRLILV